VTEAMRVVRLHLPLCVLLAGLCSSSCRNLEVVTASYASLEEARREGALAGGWVPEGLPPGTRDIREAHDLDTNRRWGLFSYPPEEADALRRLVRQEEFPLAGVSCDVPARIEWWPVLLRGMLDPEAIRTTGLRAHRAASGDLIFLVNWQQGRAYYWSLDG
jgi:hypothetical protein